MKKTIALLSLLELLFVLGFSSALAQAKSITQTSGDGQSSAITTALPQPLVVTVTDSLGSPVAGVAVDFSLTGVPPSATGQSLSNASVTTDLNGQAATTLTLGSKVGTYSVSATSGTLTGSPVPFTATAVAGPAKNITYTSGNGQSGQVATPLASPFVVTVTDIGGNPVSGKSVNFVISAPVNGATLSASNVNTDALGQAGTTLTLGTKTGTYTVTATTSGVTGSVVFTATGNAGPATQVIVETAADGSGVVVPAQNLGSGSSLTGYAITRDANGNFIANVAASAWAVINASPGITSADLVPSGNMRSATFTGDSLGSAQIQASYNAVTPVPSNLITVVVGAPARIKVETRADGSGKVVPDTTLPSGSALTVYAIERDINNHYIANIAADTWTLPTKTAGVVDADLQASGDRKNATFTGHLIGTATIRATSGVLAPTVSGTISVTVGSAKIIDSTSGGQQSGQVMTPLANPLVVTVTDASGNPVAGRTITWAVASYPAGATGQVVNPTSSITDASGHASTSLTLGTKKGSYTVTATSTGLTGSPVVFSATAISGSGTQVRVETAADGSGDVIPNENLNAGAKDTAFAILRDAYLNFVQNVSATWSLVNINGGIVATDLAPTTGTSSIFTAHAAGSARIQAVYDGLPAATSGIITVLAGTATKIRIETRADGTGDTVSARTMLASRSLTVYSIARDIGDNFIGNYAAATWSMQSKLGGVADSDLVASSDMKSAVFTAHRPGSGAIRATYPGLTPGQTGTITVVKGTPAFVQVETKADGSGIIVPAQSIMAMRSVTAYAISRDSAGNFLANVLASNWSIQNWTEGVADSDLVASGDKSSAVFTGHGVGTGQIRAQYLTLTPYLSGILTVDKGTAAKVRVETKADGTGVIVPDQVIPSGDSIKVYSVVRDSANNFLQNVAANIWSLTGKTGAVLDGDLVASTNRMSATFTGHGLGGAKIQATSSTLQVVPSGQLTVGIGAAAKLVFVQQPSTIVSQATMTPAVTVRIEDVNGNLVGSDSRDVTLSLLHNTTGATLGGTTTVAAAGGIATFSNLTVDKADSQYTLLATSSPVLTRDTSSAFIVLPGTLTGFTVEDSAGGPIPAQNAGVPFKVRISARDAAGNVVTGFTETVNVTASNGGILGTGGGTTVAFTNGVLAAHTVSFSSTGSFSLSVRRTLGFEGGTSNVFDVNAGLPAQVKFYQQPTNAVAGSFIAPAMTVQLQDAFGNNISQGGVPVTIELWSGTGVLTGTKLRNTNTSGLATFPNLSIDSAGVKVLRAISGELTPAISDSFRISAGAAARVGFAVNPGAGTAGTPFPTQPVVVLQDQFGNTVTGVSETVTLAIQTNPSEGTLGGTKTVPVNTVTGQAAFTDLFIDKAGVGYTLTATGVGVSTTPGVIVSTPFNITSGTAARLAFSVQPSAAVAGAIISPAVVVQVQDQYGNLVSVNDTLVTLSMDSTGNLGGNVSRTTVAGLATFNDLRIDKEGVKVLRASGTGMTNAVSASFTISAGPAAKLAFTTQPGSGVAGFVLGPQPVLTLQDAFGNTAKGTAQNVTISLKDTAVSGASLNGTKTVAVNIETGTASFTDLSIDKAGVGFTLTAVGSTVDTALGVVVSQPVTVIAGSAKKLRIETLADGKGTVLATQNVSSGVPISVYAIGRDSLGNFVTNVAADQWQLVDMTGGAKPSDLVPAADRKSAVFTGTAIGSSARILATMAGLSPDTSGVLSVVQPGAPAKILVETFPNGTGTIVPSQSIASGGSITVYAVERDASNNFVANVAPDSWSLQVLSGDVQAGDLVPSADKKSAVFTAHKIGKLRIVSSVATLAEVPSDTIRVVAGTPATIAVGSKSPDSARVNNYFGSRLVTLVRDSSGNPVRNVLVTYSVPASGATSVFDEAVHTATTDSLGQATSRPLRANTVVGQYSDTARVTGIPGEALFVLRNLAGAPASVTTVTGSGQTTEIATAFPLPLVVSVKDSFGNAVDNERVTFTAPPSGPSGTFQGSGLTNSVNTNAQGVGTSAVFVANPQAGSYTVLASAGSAPAAKFSLTNGPGNAGTIEAVDGMNQSAMVGKAFAKRLKARVKDISNNVIPNALVHFTAPASGASGVFPGGITDSSTTDTLGIATSSLFTADTVAGTYNITATVSNMSGSAQFALTNAPGPVDTFDVEAAGGGAIVQQTAHVPFPIRITAKDAYNNVATGFTGTVDIIPKGSSLWAMEPKTPAFRAGVLDSHYVSMASAGGPDTLTVRRTGGAETGQSNPFSVVNPAPTVKSINPPNGLAGQTLVVTIVGTGFISGVTQVTFGDQITTATVSVNDTVFMVRISIDAAAALGPRSVTLFNPGQPPITIPGGFVVGVNARPTITSISPDSVAQLQSTKVTVRGDSLLGATQITFVPATGLSLDSVGVVGRTEITFRISVSASASLGPHDVIVTNPPPGGGSDTLLAAIHVIPPTGLRPPTLKSPADQSQNQPSTLTLTWDSVAGAAGYDIQVATSSTFSTGIVVFDSMLTTPSHQVGPLTAQTVYYWRARSRNVLGISVWSDAWSFDNIPYPVTYSLTNTVTFQTRANPSDYAKEEYQLVGLPGAQNGSLSTLIPGTPRTDWDAYWDNGAQSTSQSSYLVEFTEGDSRFTWAAGRGFWLIKKGPWALTNQSVNTAPLRQSTGSVHVSIHSGWNIITNPFVDSLAWTSIRSANAMATGEKLWGPRFANGLIQGWDSSAFMVAYKGYYYYNDPSVLPVLDTLRFPYGLRLGKKSSKMIAAAVDTNAWTISVDLKVGRFEDQTTSLGVSSFAQEGKDRFDYHKPRPFAEIPVVFFDRPEWDKNYSVFGGDIRNPFGRIGIWELTVSTTGPKAGNAEINLRGVENVPANFGVYLVDEAGACYRDIRKVGTTYKFVPAAPTVKFKVLVGTKEALDQEAAKIVPRSFALDQNYPNPFNPSTTIPVSVPYVADVTLKIYNIMGQEVATVFSGTLEPGKHMFTWEGRNRSGTPVASGVYFVRMTTPSGPSFVGKMLLMK